MYFFLPSPNTCVTRLSAIQTPAFSLGSVVFNPLHAPLRELQPPGGQQRALLQELSPKRSGVSPGGKEPSV